MHPKMRKRLLDAIICDFIDSVEGSDDYLSESVYSLLKWADKEVRRGKDAHQHKDVRLLFSGYFME